MSRLPVLMFDFGNVIAFFDYSPMFGRFGARLGVTGEQLERDLADRGLGAIGREFERGRLSAEEFAARVTSLAGLEMSFKDFVQDFPDIFTLNAPAARLAADLKRQGYRLLLGSNTNVLHATFYRRKFAEALEPFDDLVFSYEIGAMKPDAAFYEACAERAQVPAGSCLFIDDVAANVEGARAAGMQAVLFRDTSRLVADLRRLGVEVPGSEG